MSGALPGAAVAAAGVAAMGAFIACVRVSIEPAVRAVVDPLLISLEAKILSSISARLASAHLPSCDDVAVTQAATAVLDAVRAVLDNALPPTSTPVSVPSGSGV